MEEFIKPIEVILDTSEIINSIFDGRLVKHLHDNEAICPVCGGTGIIVENNIYGLKNDPNKSKHFPYKHQSISFCKNCYNGVIRVCKYCGENATRTYHQCDIIKAEKREKERLKELENFSKAKEYNHDALGTTFGMCYSKAYGYNEGYFNSWEDFFEYIYSEELDDTENKESRPTYVWGTEKVEMKIDAYSIVESATEDLYDEAMSSISSSDINTLQSILDDWCYGCGVGSTYIEDNRYKVRVPWELF